MRKITRFLLTFGLFLFLTLSSAPMTFAQDAGPTVRITQVDNSQFPQVTVYISITDASGEPLAVDPSTLQVFENGQLMQPASVSGQGEIGQLTTLLVIDVSGSMVNSNKMDGAKKAAKAYVDQMRPGDQAGLISFNTQVKVVQPVTTDKAALDKAIDSLTPAGNTAMFDALLQGVDTLTPIAGRKAIILLSDGMDNRSKHKLDDVIHAIGPAGLSISTIGLGNPNEAGNNFGLDEPALKSLAERAGGVYGFATAPDALLALYQQQGRALQNEFSFTYISPSTLRDGVNRQLSVSIGNGIPAITTQYNPGGVLPEVPAQSWTLFGGILAGLLILLALPFVISRGLQAAGGSAKKKGRVKMGQADSPSPSKGRVRLK